MSVSYSPFCLRQPVVDLKAFEACRRSVIVWLGMVLKLLPGTVIGSRSSMWRVGLRAGLLRRAIKQGADMPCSLPSLHYLLGWRPAWELRRTLTPAFAGRLLLAPLAARGSSRQVAGYVNHQLDPREPEPVGVRRIASWRVLEAAPRERQERPCWDQDYGPLLLVGKPDRPFVDPAEYLRPLADVPWGWESCCEAEWQVWSGFSARPAAASSPAAAAAYQAKAADAHVPCACSCCCANPMHAQTQTLHCITTYCTIHHTVR